MMIYPQKLGRYLVPKLDRYLMLLLLVFGIFLGVKLSQSEGDTTHGIDESAYIRPQNDVLSAIQDEQPVTRQTDRRLQSKEYNKEAVLDNIMNQINKTVTQDQDLEVRLGEKDDCYEYRRSATKRRPVAYDVLRHIRAPLLTNDSITLIGHMTYSKLDHLIPVIQNWDGPISIAMYMKKSLISEMMNTFEKLDIIRNSTILLHVVPEEEDLYPVNYLRNLAFKACTTHYVFLMDIDFVPMPRAHHILKNYLQPNRHQVMVVPAFEEISQDSMPIFPQNKSDLIKMWQKGTILSPFHFEKNWKPGHALTDFDRWEKENTTYIINAAKSKPFEPYIVGERSELPLYSELFAGRGFNKIQQIMEVKAMKFEFVVCPEVFIIHLWHKRPSYKGFWCSNQSRALFLEYMKKKYGQ